jgi:purine-binding chemotaxis protein CheW
MERGFDRQAAEGRPEPVGGAGERREALSPIETQEILRRRAEILARAETAPPGALAPLNVLVYAQAGERWGIEMGYVAEVVPWDGGTAVPGAPEFLAGIMNHRGRILPVVNLCRLLSPERASGDGGRRVIAASVNGMRFGIQAEAVEGSLQVDAGCLATAPRREGENWGINLRGLTPDGIAILDLPALVRAGRLLIDQGS